MFCVGDKVRISKREPLEGGNYDWVDAMDEFDGKITTISHSILGGYALDIDRGFYGWDEAWLTPVTTPVEDEDRELVGSFEAKAKPILDGKATLIACWTDGVSLRSDNEEDSDFKLQEGKKYRITVEEIE